MIDAVMVKKKPRNTSTARSTKSSFLGTWKLIEMDEWDVDSDGELRDIIKFSKGEHGDLNFAAMQAGIDWRVDRDAGQIEFTFHGHDEGDEVMGRGRCRVDDDGLLRGMIWFHLGDESGFVAKKR